MNRCNGEDNCGNRFDELFNCGTVNLYYIFGGDPYQNEYLSSNGFWFAVRILILLFLISLLLYTTSLLCRCCYDRKGRGFRITGKSPIVYLRSTKKGINQSDWEPLLASTSSNSSGGGGGYGHYANGRNGEKISENFQLGPTQGIISPPPSYFGNQSDNQGAHVNEYIYVNNNYGQPLGSTTVRASARPMINGTNLPPYQNPSAFPPLYSNIEHPNYGGTNNH